LEHDKEIMEIKKELTKSVLSRGSLSQNNQGNECSIDEKMNDSYSYRDKLKLATTSREHSANAKESSKKKIKERFNIVNA